MNTLEKMEMKSLYKNGLRKIADGITSFEEVNKILFSLGEFENEL